jgi:hypothetical protein
MQYPIEGDDGNTNFLLPERIGGFARPFLIIAGKRSFLYTGREQRGWAKTWGFNKKTIHCRLHSAISPVHCAHKGSDIGKTTAGMHPGFFYGNHLAGELAAWRVRN